MDYGKACSQCNNITLEVLCVLQRIIFTENKVPFYGVKNEDIIFAHDIHSLFMIYNYKLYYENQNIFFFIMKLFSQREGSLVCALLVL